MNVRLSACGALLWDAGRLVWDDYLDHRQFALADGVERVLRWFTGFRPLDSVREMADDPGEAAHWHQIATVLADNDVLICENGPRHRREQAVERAWRPWGPLARAYHFSSRSHASTAMRTAEQDNEELEAKVLTDPPPPAFWSLPAVSRHALPDPDPHADPGVWRHRDLIDVLHRRRSRRCFGGAALPLDVVAALLKTAAGPLPRVDGPLTQAGVTLDPGGVLTDSWQRVFKTSPSGGARHPTEVYLYARDVDGLAPGAYHYAAADHSLEHLGRRLDDERLVAAVGDQDWVAGAGALIFYTSVIARNQWKYTFPRVYRALLMDVGHLSQTVYLLATAAGLHITFTAALRDELVEELLGCDPAGHLVIGASVIGAAPAR
ncbi:SagB family peptide dehydrogenase [Microbispora sp. NPDC088329]|uniref:SagB family peptide dehydrogenase n=1 Tax=Microbispora sp. NPDC088329 TaxID=3154869 RepID=UPI0034471C1C